MCSLQLIGAEALVLELITFSEAAPVTSNPRLSTQRPFSLILRISQDFCLLEFQTSFPVHRLTDDTISTAFLRFSRIIKPTFMTLVET